MLKHQVRLSTRKDKRYSTAIPKRELPTFSEASSSENITDEDQLTFVRRYPRFQLPGRRSVSVSSLSSTGSSCSGDSSAEWGTLRIYTQAIKQDTDYKTVFVSTTTSAGQLIQLVLNKLRLNFRDPKLYYLTMQLRTKTGGLDLETVLVLDPSAKPLDLQNCHPREKSRFFIRMHPGTPVRIYDYCLCPESNYKSILISPYTTCAEAITLMLQCHRSSFCEGDFVLISYDPQSECELLLPPDAGLLSITEHLSGRHQLHIRPFAQARRSLCTSTPILEHLINQLEACHS